MRLENCNINPRGVVLSPFIRNDAEEDWVSARDKEEIPRSLFDLYRTAAYLSFGAAPRFLSDSDSVLFSYFSAAMRSLKTSLGDALAFKQEVLSLQEEIYHPGRALKDPSWTRQQSEEASKRSSMAFRNFLLSLHAALDTTAEIIAIFSQGGIRGLEVGNAQFARIEKWLNSPYTLNIIASPREAYLAQLQAKLLPLVHSAGVETDWLPYMRLLRNKAAHLGHGFFRWVGLTGPDEQQYTFIPREWPYLWERYIHGPEKTPSMSLPNLLTKTLVHDDLVAYTHGALRKVINLIDEATKVTAAAYVDFSDFEFNQTALDELNSNSKTFAFERFVT